MPAMVATLFQSPAIDLVFLPFCARPSYFTYSLVTKGRCAFLMTTDGTDLMGGVYGD